MFVYKVNPSTPDAELCCDMSEALRFSPHGMPEDKLWEVKFDFFEARMSEQRHRCFDIVRSQIRSHRDCCLYSKHDGGSFLSLGIVLKGNVEFTLENRRYSWTATNANILIGADYHDEFNYFCGGDDFEMLNIVISTDFFRMLAERYPAEFESAYERMTHGETFFLSAHHRKVGNALSVCVRQLSESKQLGNISEMYLESKIQEAISLFLRNDAIDIPTHIRPDLAEKVLHARDILTAEYLAPPTLHELARRIGTNECTLKSSFKQLFQQTVFDFLFDHRMQLASAYLSDTDKSIAEIASLVGYEYPAHFTVAFKRKFGITPSAFRQRR